MTGLLVMLVLAVSIVSVGLDVVLSRLRDVEARLKRLEEARR